MSNDALPQKHFAFQRRYVIFSGHFMSNTNTQLINALNWRYATKVFDASKKIPADVWSAIEQTLVLTPTSFGLQPYKFVIVQNPAVREALLPQSWGQKQVVDCSHYVVFLARTEMKEADIDKLLNRIVEVRGVPADSLKGYRDMMIGNLVTGGRASMAFEWAARQSYIALGNAMTAAAVLGVDGCPMEGIAPDQYDKILKLEGTGYKTVVALALGYRAASDKYATTKKVRYETKDLIQHV
jgi:nitroreductase